MKTTGQNVKHYVAVFESIPLPVMLFDFKGIVLDINREAARIFFNRDPKTLLSKPEKLKEKLQDLHQELKDFIDSGEESRSLQKTLLCIERETTFDINFQQLKESDGLVVYIITLKDITAMLKLEEEKKQGEHIMRQQSKMAEMGEMIGAIAHQWRQPLNAIALYVQNIEDRILDGDYSEEKLQKSVESIMGSLNYMSKTIDDFRNFFKPDKRIETFSVQKVISSVVELIAAQLTNHTIKVEITGNDFKMEGYPNEFKQAVLNLISNAKEAIIERQSRQMFEGEIIIHTDKNMISVKDNGTGIPDDLMEKIGTPYFTTKGEGTGIGLFMTKAIIEEALHGKFLIQNNTDEGAEVKILFQGHKDD